MGRGPRPLEGAPGVRGSGVVESILCVRKVVISFLKLGDSLNHGCEQSHRISLDL